MKRKTKGNIFIVLIAVFVMGGFIYTTYFEEYPICQGEERTGFELDCCEGCNKFGLEYLHYTYSRGGWGREGVDDCFCRNGTQSIQIY